jgi:hypothetical protein
MKYNTPYRTLPNSGTVFEGNSTNEKAPAFSGTLTLSPDLLKQLPKNEEGHLTMRLAVWKKKSAAGKPYLSIQASKPMDQQKKEEWE